MGDNMEKGLIDFFFSHFWREIEIGKRDAGYKEDEKEE
jgi:hypothetical protein